MNSGNPNNKKGQELPEFREHEMLSVNEITDHLLESAAALLESDPLQAEEILSRALTLSKKSRSAAGTGRSLSMIAVFESRKGNFQGTISMLKEAAACFEDAGMHAEAAACFRKIGTEYAAAGQLHASIEAEDQALAGFKKAGDLIAQGDIFNRKGELHQLLHRYDDAMSCFHKALEIFEITGNPEFLSITNYLSGVCCLKKGEHDLAYNSLEKGKTLAETTGKPELIARTAGGFAQVLFALKETNKAIRQFNAALETARKGNDLQLLAELLRESGKAILSTNKHKQALASLKEALEIAISEKLRFLLPDIYHALAEAEAKAGHFEAAYEHLFAAVREAETLRNEELKVIGQAAEIIHSRSIEQQARTRHEQFLTGEQFLLHLGHEVRTPLNGVLGMVGLLSGTHPTHEQTEYIKTIRLSAGNLLRYIDELFEYQRLLHEGTTASPGNIRLKSLVSELQQVLMPLAAENDVVLSIRPDPTIAEQLTGDPEFVRIITEKLSRYAIINSAGGQVSIRFSLIGSGKRQLQIIVSGSGITLSPGDLHRMLGDEFLPISNNLSIAIAGKLTNIWGGRMSVLSAPGGGCEMSVALPLTGTFSGIPSAGEPLIDTEVKKKILLVEDNKVNQFLAQKLLTKMGFEVMLSGNASEAVEALQREQFDAILMDVQMPIMTGYELTELIRTKLPAPVNQIPIIALTAYASPQEREKAMACGMNEFLTKPYSPEELKAVLLKTVRSNVPLANGTASDGDINGNQITQTVDRLTQLFGGSVEDTISLVNMLIVQIPQLLDEAEINIANSNWTACFHVFHKIRSSINLLKIPELSHMIAELEEFSKDRIHSGRIPQLFKQFRKNSAAAVGFLKEEVVRLRRS